MKKMSIFFFYLKKDIFELCYNYVVRKNEYMSVTFTNKQNKKDINYKEISIGYRKFFRIRNSIAYSINKEFGDFYTSFFKTTHDAMSVFKIEQELRKDETLKKKFFDSKEYDKWPGETFENVCGDYDFENQFSRYVIDLAYEEDNKLKQEFVEDYNNKINDKIFMIRFGVDMDVVDFMYMPDCDGKCSYKTCKKIYDAIENNDDEDLIEFKQLLKDCFKNKKDLVWY